MILKRNTSGTFLLNDGLGPFLRPTESQSLEKGPENWCFLKLFV